MTRLRILQLISSGGYYGAENVAIELSLALKHLNHEPTIGVFRNAHRPNSELAEEAQRRGLQIEMIDCRGKIDFRTISAVRNCILQRQMDVVHSHGYKANIYAYMAARGTNARLVATCHNWPGKTVALRLYAALDRFLLRRFPGIAAVSDPVRDSLLRSGVPNDRIRLVQNGIDTESFSRGQPVLKQLPQVQGKKVVGFIGRLAQEKGLAYLMQAAESIVREDSNVAFVFAGDGPYRDSLCNLIKKLNLETHVVLLGKRSDMVDVYASIDVLVLPSLSEGVPMVVLEAMAAGKPVLATKVGGIPQVIQDEKTGLLVDPADASQLTIALKRLLASPHLREELGRRGRDRVSTCYSAGAMAQAYLTMYREVGSQTSGVEKAPPTVSPTNNVPQMSTLDYPQISIIIPALNEEAVIGRCLDSLAKNNFPKSAFEVIVVDNGSTDRTIDIAKSFEKVLALKVLKLEKAHISALRNRGAAEAGGKFLAFLDADCLAPENWLHFAVERLSSRNTGIIGGHCTIPKDSPWVTRVWYGDRQTVKRGHVSYVPAANLLLSQVNFIEIGSFDESLETNEECEFCNRARKKTLTVVAYPELGVVHLRDPQTIGAFFRKHRWHGKHVFKVFVRNLPSIVNGRSVFFALYTALALLGVVVSLVAGHLVWFGFSVGLLFSPSVVLSMRIVLRRQRWMDFAPLLLLHATYGFARASALLDLRNWLGRSKTSERIKLATRRSSV
jgi:glycosyltransferase involved in cell wall biosynthesis